jgi:carbon monoxide dehydrogenase subunit G
MQLQGQIHIDATPGAVWAVLADWEGQVAWMPDVAWVRLVSSERELGARLEVRTRVFGVPATTDLVVVTGWRPPERGLVSGRGAWERA